MFSFVFELVGISVTRGVFLLVGLDEDSEDRIGDRNVTLDLPRDKEVVVKSS